MHRTIRAEYGVALAKWGIRNGASHFLTIQPGIHADGFRLEDSLILKPVGILLADYARERANLPRAAALREAHLPWMAGVIERRDRFGNAHPHLHFLIALGPYDEPFLRGVLRRRLGRDATPSAESLMSLTPGDGVRLARDGPKAVPHDFPTDRRIVKRWGPDPSFDLRPIFGNDQRLGTYLTKQSGDPDVVTHLSLLDASGTPLLSDTRL